MRKGPCIATLLLLPAIAVAVDQGSITSPTTGSATRAALTEPLLQPYEPTTGGYTQDSDDVGFIDVNLSLKIRIAPDYILPRVRPFLAMTTRFGFYWGTRPGSPVIGKTYNPALLLRILARDALITSPDGSRSEYAEFVNVGYAHESNGQLIHTQQQYQQELVSAPDPDFADNFIHRGWDYLDVAWKKNFGSPDVSMTLEGKYFLPNGLLQGAEDEYHSWEANPQGKPRKAVDGISAAFGWPTSAIDFPVNDLGLRPNLFLKYTTGYQTPFAYSTLRAELGLHLASLPVVVWGQHGYMSSLANYYKKVDSVGIELRFDSF
jgi:outer membrane phospholipase A